MAKRDVEELLATLRGFEHFLGLPDVPASRQQAVALAAQLCRMAHDSTVAALATDVAAAIEQHGSVGEFGSIAKHRLHCALDRFRFALERIQLGQAALA